ncbi:MAG: 50S ribosomal protein L9 [Candidatus Cloacimonadota bacterium]|nr:MAG: 50S ribosomal protein L9 [Candidatus Cloacimonadota bacterium]
MKVILIKDTEKLGSAGSVLKVKDGFARNYLLPKKIAIIATKNNLSKLEQIKEKAEAEKTALENEYKLLVDKINNTELIFTRKADENGHLFGSVSEHDIVEELEKQEIKIHKSNVELEKHLKELGEFEVKIAFTPAISANLKIKVEKE